MHRALFTAGGLRGLQLASRARTVAAAVSMAAVGSVAYVRIERRRQKQGMDGVQPQQPRLVLPLLFLEGICGAVGEIAQISVLYPLETLKVKCQGDGLSTAAVMAQLMQRGPAAACRALYAGFGAAALLSVIVGSVHYASFCYTKRAAQQQQKQQQQQQQQQQLQQQQRHQQQQQEGSSMHDQAGTNVLAATVGALATALVEAPAEMFRHQAQAGRVQGNFIGAMVAAVRKGGPGALYAGFVPFCIESLPFDVVELGTYSTLQDMAAAEAGQQTLMGRIAKAVPDQALDLAMGALAGTAAVLISMPLDVIKTHMQVNAAGAVTGGVAAQTAAFWATGRAMVAVGGPGALFVGLLPRLAQQVPSSTVCWWAVEQSRVLLCI